MDFQKQFFGEQPSVDAFKVKIKEDEENYFRNLKVPIF